MPTDSNLPTVCQLVHGLPIGGAEVLVNRIIRTLRDRFRFVVACLDEVGHLGELLAQDGIRVVSLGRRPGFDWKCVRQLRRLCVAEGVQLIHAHQYTPFAYALATRLFGRRPPVLLTEHGRFFPDYPSRKRMWFNRLLSEPRDRFVAVGNSVRQALLDNEGFPPNRVEVVYNGVGLPACDADVAGRAAIRAELGLAGDDFMVVQVARLDPIKDHNTAIRAIGLAARACPRMRLFIVGDGPEKLPIQQAIDKQGLAGQVTMLGLRNDVRRLLTAADAFLLTSVSEGIPITILEAMVASVPVVATSVGGVPELIRDEATGLLAPAGNAEQLAGALVRLAENPALGTALASRAKCQVEANFSETSMIANYERIYRNMLAATAMAA
jgi:glycosyltransferase involved in cell wall biosynthesis